MRGARSTLVMLVVFIALGAYVYFVELERPPASETPPNEQLFGVESEDIQTLTVRGTASETSLRRAPGDRDDGWQLTAPVTATADRNQVSSITSGLASIEIRRVLEEGPVDLDPFGLTTPEVEVAFTASDDDAERRLLIGSITPTGSDRYAKLADVDRVFLVPESLEGTFNKSTFQLRDKSILEFETADVDRLEVTAGDLAVAFEKTDNEWRMVTPLEVRADFSTVQGLIGRLGSGQMVAVESEDGAAAGVTTESWDFETPTVTATVGVGSATATLVVGGDTPDGTRYARDAARPLVFTVDQTLVDDLLRGAEEYRRKDLFGFRSFNATRFEVERPDETLVYEKSEVTNEEDESTETVWTRVEPDTAEVERSDMDDLLAKFSNLRADSFIGARDEAGLDESTILATIRVTYGDDDTEERVVFWRTGDETFGVNGEEPGAGLVDTRSVDDAFEALIRDRVESTP